MKCPHCEKSVGFFSKEMNRFGKEKHCPHCNGSVRLVVGLIPALLWFAPAVVLSLLLQPALGFLGTGVSIGLLMVLSFRLRPYS